MNFLLKIFLFYLIGIVFCQRAARKLKLDLFSNYDSQSRPVEDPSVPTNVCVGLYLLQIVGLSERSQNDSFLTWNASEYDNVTQLYLKSTMVWTPDIIIMDSAEEKTQRGNRENYMLIVNYSGLIKWHYQTLSKSFCEIDIMNFPFDSQICSIRIRSSSRDKKMLRIIKRNMKVKVKENIKTEWFIINSAVEETSLILNKNSRILEFNVLDFKLTLRRVTTYYFLKIIFPFTIIAFITLFTFWLAPDSGEKLTLDVTVLLSLVFYLQIMSEYIPRGYSKMPILTLYTLGNFTLVFLSCAMTVFVLKLYYRPRTLITSKYGQLPYLARLVLFKYLSRILFLNFYFRKKEEFFDIDVDPDDPGCCGINHSTVNNKSTPARKQKTKDLINRKMKIFEEVIDLKQANLNNENENLESYCNEILSALKYLNKSIRKSKILQRENVDGKSCQEKSMYLEEWKQAALVLDRLFFFVFLISMPMTTLIFFRANIFEYLSSSGENSVRIPNINC